MGQTWVKLYTETAKDRKVRSLDPALRWCWVGVLMLAGDCDDGTRSGRLEMAPGEPIGDEEIADFLAVSVETWRQGRAVFLRRGMLTETDGCLVVTHFEERQDSPEAKRKRAQRQRSRQSQDSHRTVTANVTTEAEAETEREIGTLADVPGGCGGETPASLPPAFQALSPRLREAATILQGWSLWRLPPPQTARRVTANARTFPTLDLAACAMACVDHYTATGGKTVNGKPIGSGPTTWDRWLADEAERRAANGNGHTEPSAETLATGAVTAKQARAALMQGVR